MGNFDLMTTLRGQCKKSLERGFEQLLNMPGRSFSQVLGNGFRQTIAGILSQKKNNERVMLSGHLQQTIQRSVEADGSYIVVPQDTTTFNYNGHKDMDGLGVLQGNIRGILQHNVLAINEVGVPLGLVYQHHWSRGEQSAKPFDGAVESEKWLNGLAATNAFAKKVPHKTVVSVQDREGDVWDLFKAERAKNVALVVRAFQPRNLEVIAHGSVHKLHSIGSHLQESGTHTVQVQRNNKTVRLTLSISFGGVNVYPPKGLSPRLHKTEGFSLVVARETAAVDEQGNDVFNEKDAAVWFLLTTLPVESLEDAIRVVTFYSLRWRIERFHFTLKTGGLHVEKLQFDDIHTTINALVYYSTMAVEMLCLTYAARQHPDDDATKYYTQEEVTLLSAIAKTEITTINAAVLALVSLVNFVPTKKQALPGVKVLSQALERFQFVKIGAKILPASKPY